MNCDKLVIHLKLVKRKISSAADESSLMCMVLKRVFTNSKWSFRLPSWVWWSGSVCLVEYKQLFELDRQKFFCSATPTSRRFWNLRGSPLSLFKYQTSQPWTILYVLFHWFIEVFQPGLAIHPKWGFTDNCPTSWLWSLCSRNKLSKSENESDKSLCQAEMTLPGTDWPGSHNGCWQLSKSTLTSLKMTP